MKQQPRKDAAVEFMYLVASGKVQEAYDRHVGRNFRHHNPYFRGDAKSLQTAMAENAAKNPNKKVDIQFALEEGDRVAVFSRIRQSPDERGGAAVHIFRFEGDRVAVFSRIRQNPGDRGGAAVHIFRFDGDRIAELWDVGQEVPADSVNENGMF